MATALAQAAAAAAAVTPRSSRRLQHRAAPFTSSLRPSARRPAFQQLLCASSSSDEQPQQPGQPPAADEEQQAGGAALGPRDDDVLPDSLTGALEDASRATVEALERGVDRCVVSSGRGGLCGERGLWVHGSEAAAALGATHAGTLPWWCMQLLCPLPRAHHDLESKPLFGARWSPSQPSHGFVAAPLSNPFPRSLPAAP